MSETNGERSGEYRILAKLGEGGMSVVYRAKHEVLGRVVALKVIRQEPGGCRVFSPGRNSEPILSPARL